MGSITYNIVNWESGELNYEAEYNSSCYNGDR